MQFFRSLFSSRAESTRPRARSTTLGREDEPTGQRYRISTASATEVEIGPLPRFDPGRVQKPRSYWEAFDKAESAYKNRRYKSTLRRLGQASFLASLHPTAMNLRLRTYRKLIDTRQTDRITASGRLEYFDELFAKCTDQVTNTDINRCNRFLK